MTGPGREAELPRQFVSFPKSGRSWVRYALVRLGLGDRIAFHHDGCEFNDGARPPLDLDFERRLARFAAAGPVIYMHRDPRDVMVSLFHQVTGRFRDIFEYRGSLSDFIRDPYFGAHNLREYHRQWMALCARGHALPIAYEDCHRDLEQVLGAVVRHFGWEVEPAALAAAASEASFEAMRTLEDAGTFAQPWLRRRNDAPKVRRGKVGGYRDELSPGDIGFLDAMFPVPG